MDTIWYSNWFDCMYSIRTSKNCLTHQTNEKLSSITKVDHKRGSQKWITKLDHKSGSQKWIIKADHKKGSPKCTTKLDYKVDHKVDHKSETQK